jgi:hypothetical protein
MVTDETYLQAEMIWKLNRSIFRQVKNHSFFRDINWETLARQKVVSVLFFKYLEVMFFFFFNSSYHHIWTLSKFSYSLQAMFIPSGEAHDTSYFLSRYIWNPEGENVHGGSDFEDLTDTCSSGSFSNTHDDDVSTYCSWKLLLSLCIYCFQFIVTWTWL